ncbi:MAG TPA: penicillin-binding transpeptidase domain-containing protein, partial [candidate division Zixibacteria bacterium]|nr:penicillin-binding transpeptidase domain-containing protein [candidate division Zixibacteria bacterium]
GSIQQSCDTYYYQMGLKLGINKLAEYSRKCGFGAPTQIDLPNESYGLVPTTDTLNKFYGKRGWTEGLMLNLSIGQGEILVTPLQLAQFYAGLAADGVIYRPHLVKTIHFPDGSQLDTEPKVSHQLPFSPQTLKILKEGLYAVVHSAKGTARGIAVDGLHFGGKTGTAQNPHGENHSWFVGFAPFENPQIVIAAIVENAGNGSEVAAPMVAKLLKFYVELERQRASERLASLAE